MNNTFITYEKALSIIAEHKSDLSTETRSLDDCIGTYLAEDLFADRDFPPFNRVTMDGIALNFAVFEKGERTFTIEGTAAAGTPQQKLKNNTNCMEVMTGAILPKGVDTVIRYEDLTIENNVATVNIDSLKYQQNIHFKGSDLLKGTKIVAKGIQLTSAEINIAASTGKASLQVKKMPRVVVFSTGDELVPISQIPKAHQIRRSNSYGIQATLKEWGILADLAHLNDHKEEMLNSISKTLKNYDVLIFSGGVSKGKFDFLPEVLEILNVKKQFHKIQQRPGKPFWFGTNDAGKKIFALPGNPVSSFVCTYIYFQFWLKTSLEIPQEKLFVQLKTDIHFKPELTYFLEAKLESSHEGFLVANPLKGNGSGDFTNLVKTDGFLILPQHKNIYLAGEVYPFIPYRKKWNTV